MPIFMSEALREPVAGIRTILRRAGADADSVLPPYFLILNFPRAFHATLK